MLKGRTEIILTNTRTGEVERHFDENMVTGALGFVYNGTPYAINSRGLLPNTRVIESDNTVNVTVPKSSDQGLKNALGGVLCFPEPIEEDVQRIYEPLSNYPTAYASNDAYAGENNRRGSFNASESGVVTGGYKFVWDFATNQGNGEIATVCLSNYRAGINYAENLEAVMDGAPVNFGTPNRYNVGRFSIYSGSVGAWNAEFVVAYNDDAIVFYCNDGTIRKANWKQGKANFRNELRIAESEFEVLMTNVKNKLWINKGDHFLMCTISSSTISFTEYDINGGAINTGSWSPSGVSFLTTTNRKTVIAGGYLYMPKSNSAGMYRINTNNLAEVDEITMPIEADYDGSYCGEAGGNIITPRGIIAGKTFFNNNGSKIQIVPFRQVGTWMVSLGSTYGSSNGYMSLGVTLNCIYLATINNLSSPVTKTSNKTMKIIYTVLEV